VSEDRPIDVEDDRVDVSHAGSVSWQQMQTTLNECNVEIARLHQKAKVSHFYFSLLYNLLTKELSKKAC